MEYYPPTIEGQFYPSDTFPTWRGTCRSCREDIYEVELVNGVCPSCSIRRSEGIIRAITKRSGKRLAKRGRGQTPSIVRKDRRKGR